MSQLQDTSSQINVEQVKNFEVAVAAIVLDEEFSKKTDSLLSAAENFSKLGFTGFRETLTSNLNAVRLVARTKFPVEPRWINFIEEPPILFAI